MKDLLRLDDGTVKYLGNFTAERIPFGPKSRNNKKMMIKLLTVEARDVVSGSRLMEWIIVFLTVSLKQKLNLASLE